MSASAVLDESVRPGLVLPSLASGAASAGILLALESSISIADPSGGRPYGTAGDAQSAVATAVPIAPAKSAARDKRVAASTRVGSRSTLALAPQNGQTASPRLT